MKKFAASSLLGFATMFFLTYLGGMYDDAYMRMYHTGIWYKDIIGLLKYWILWVLPYWWLMIIIGSIVLALIYYGIRIVIVKSKR